MKSGENAVFTGVDRLFFLFNFWYAGIIMILYAFIANLPCIIIQRYNRPKLITLSWKKRRKKARLVRGKRTCLYTVGITPFTFDQKSSYI